MKAPVARMLHQAAEVFDQRHAMYGDNYKQFGKVMKALFPDGMIVSSESDWNRVGVLVQVMSKITRYGHNFQNGGHEDSLLDLSVYSQMLRELDQEANDEDAPV